MNELSRTIRVRVPCSTSNLGSGFDCIGLALDRYLDVEFVPARSGGLAIERAGTLAELKTDPSGDAVASAFRAVRGVTDRNQVHGTLRMTSRIPIARGLGSSAAATVAGLLLGAIAAGRDVNAAETLGEAARIEGHPDNAAPALFGGLVGIVADANGRSRPFALPLSDRIGFAYAAPPVEISTAAARRALPAQVPHNVAVRALSRVAALTAGLATGDPGLLRAGFQDDLHVSYRLPLIPGAREAMREAVAAGAWAVTISGSGSGLIALTSTGNEAGVAEAMKDAFKQAVGSRGTGVVTAFTLHPAPTGAQVDSGAGLEPIGRIAGRPV